MMKIKYVFLVLSMCFPLVACSSEKEVVEEIKPQVTQMKSIFELATVKCYYHNVAKYIDDDATGILWWKKDRKFWVEYSGVVTIGIDTSLVKIDVEGEKVRITIPPAKVLGCKVDEKTLNEDSFIIAKDSAKVEAQHQTEAFKEAQTKMREQASQDTVLLANAQQRAQKLLEDYVKNIGNSVGKEYKIEWIYLDGAEELHDVDTDTEKNT